MQKYARRAYPALVPGDRVRQQATTIAGDVLEQMSVSNRTTRRSKRGVDPALSDVWKQGAAG